jgi:hypothetical protein
MADNVISDEARKAVNKTLINNDPEMTKQSQAAGKSSQARREEARKKREEEAAKGKESSKVTLPGISGAARDANSRTGWWLLRAKHSSTRGGPPHPSPAAHLEVVTMLLEEIMRRAFSLLKLPANLGRRPTPFVSLTFFVPVLDRYRCFRGPRVS